MNRYKEAKAWIDRMNAHPEFAVIEITEPALSQVTRLLERATPKKVQDTKKNIFGLFSSGYCPVCGEECLKDVCYCDNCGQALDWKNEVQEDEYRKND